MKFIRGLAIIVLFLILGTATLPRDASALVAYPDWVEVDVSLRPDGKAIILYRIKYQIDQGDMGAFYFMDMAGSPIFDKDNSFAESDDGNRFPLSISSLSSRKFDIVLSNGQRYRPGNLIFTLCYGLDLGLSGNLAKSTSPELGDVVVFNWAPVQWDNPLSHQTSMIHYPIDVEGEEVNQEFLDSVVFRTEPWRTITLPLSR